MPCTVAVLGGSCQIRLDPSGPTPVNILCPSFLRRMTQNWEGMWKSYVYNSNHSYPRNPRQTQYCSRLLVRLASIFSDRTARKCLAKTSRRNSSASALIKYLQTNADGTTALAVERVTGKEACGVGRSIARQNSCIKRETYKG